MEVFETTENNTQVLVASNWTQDTTISVWGLVPESNYIISVKSVNDRGESSPVYVGGKTEGFIQSLPRAVAESRLPLLFVIVGILVSLMLLGALVTATIAIRKRRLNKYRAQDEFAAAGRMTEVVANNNSAANNSSIVSGRSSTIASDGEEEEETGEDDEEEEEEEEEEERRAEEEAGMMPLLVRDNENNDGAMMIRRIAAPERKVSFRDGNICPCCHHKRPKLPPGSTVTPSAAAGSMRRLAQSNVDLNGASSLPLGARQNHYGAAAAPMLGPNGLPVERAIVRTFSIDKMRPICRVCNPVGTTPYPAENPLDELHRSLMMQANS